MEALVFYTSTNRKGRKDATGAFWPEALAFQRIWRVPPGAMFPIDQTVHKSKRRLRFEQDCLRARTCGRYDAVAYFGHGTPRGLPGLGYSMTGDGHLRMASFLAEILRPNSVVVLYACLAGKGFGFGDALDAALPESVRTISHLTAGHTSWNPFAEYSGEGPTRSGVPIIAPGDPLWGEWIRRLRNDQRFRLTFPFMSQRQIALELGDDHFPPGPSKLMEERP